MPSKGKKGAPTNSSYLGNVRFIQANRCREYEDYVKGAAELKRLNEAYDSYKNESNNILKILKGLRFSFRLNRYRP